MTSSLDDQLAKLEDTGLIQLARLEPDLEYLFRHVLVQDATYESLLKQDRRVLHRVVGEALEALYPDRLETLAPALAHHFDEAHDSERALRYLTLAADHAFAQYANEEAIAFYTRALAIASSADDLPTDARIYLYRNLGRAHELRGEYQQALELYQTMEAQAEERAEPPMILAATLAQAVIQATPTPIQNAELSIQLSEQAADLARSLSDRAAESRALWTIGLAHMYGLGNADGAISAMQKSLVIARELDLREQMAFTLTDMSNLYTLMGSALEGLNGLQEARSLWRELGNKPMLCFSLSLSAEMAILAGDMEAAFAMTDESIAVATSIGNTEALAYACGMRGIALAHRDDVTAAIQMLFRAIEASKVTGSVVLALIPQYVLASVYASIGSCDRALGVKQSLRNTGILGGMPPLFTAQVLVEMGAVDRACTDPAEYIRETTAIIEGMTISNPRINIAQWAGVSLGAAHLALGELDQALANVDHFLMLAKANDWNTRIAEALEVRARILKAMGRDEEEAASLTEARQLAEAIGLPDVQWRVYAALAEYQDRRGNTEEATSLRRAARAIVDRVASSLDDPHLKRGFLAMPEIRSLIRGGSAA